MKRILFFIVCISLMFAGIAMAAESEINAKLIEAAKNDNLADVDAALTAGADVNAKNNFGATALMAASGEGYTEVVKLLLERGADVNVNDIHGLTPLTHASNAEVAKLLLEKGAMAGAYTLRNAVIQNHADIIKLFLDKGVINKTNGIRLLMIAQEKGYTDIVQLLENAGVKAEEREYMDYYNTEAMANLRNAATFQEAYYVDNETYTDSIENLEGDKYGFHIDAGVTIKVISAGKDHYQMIAFHEQGNKKYQLTGPGGRIEEYLE